jgi:hypothetical protein
MVRIVPEEGAARPLLPQLGRSLHGLPGSIRIHPEPGVHGGDPPEDGAGARAVEGSDRISVRLPIRPTPLRIHHRPWSIGAGGSRIARLRGGQNEPGQEGGNGDGGAGGSDPGLGDH